MNGYSYDDCKKNLHEILSDLGLEPGALQWKWRNTPPPFPGVPEKFPGPEHDAYMKWLREAELSILDALMNCGGATAWCGDGSSCAAQILEAVVLSVSKEIK